MPSIAGGLKIAVQASPEPGPSDLAFIRQMGVEHVVLWTDSRRAGYEYYASQRDKLFKVHFRNVEAPLPHFVETFLNAGYMDMYKVMRALREVDFGGVVIADHIPRITEDARLGTAYTVGTMQALIQRANEESTQDR